MECIVCMRKNCRGAEKLKDCPFARGLDETWAQWKERIPTRSRLGRLLAKVPPWGLDRKAAARARRAS